MTGPSPVPESSAAESPPVPQTRLVPPTSPVASARAQQKLVWPNVIGIVCIIFATGGIGTGLWGLLAPFIMKGIMLGDQRAVMQRHPHLNLLLAALALLLGALLLIGGIALLQRCRWSARVLMGWSMLKIVLGVINLFVQLMIQQEMWQAINTPGSGTIHGPAVSVQSSMIIVSVALGLVWVCALPAFLLIWFIRPRIRRDMTAHFHGNHPSITAGNAAT
ncbi:MAG: hypothetical protein IT445_01615 [Phycisphaeraceae bacterium]|nr:hypothetical protein [Phycisphaeraceae bacterium]